MDEEERQHLEALLRTHIANLRQLEEQAAKHGANIPLSIHNGIVEEKNKLNRVRTKLGTLAPPRDRTSLRHLRGRALAAYFQKQWEQAVDMLLQVVVADPADDDIQQKLNEAKYQLRLQEDYHAACDLRNDGQWQSVLAAMDDIARRHPHYPDAEGLREWAVNRQEQEIAARTAAINALASTPASRRFSRSHLFSNLVILLLFLGIVAFVTLWAVGQGNQNPSANVSPTTIVSDQNTAIPAITTPIQLTITPTYAGIITYKLEDGDQTTLMLNGTPIASTFTSKYAHVQVLSVSPDRRYLAVAASPDVELTQSIVYPRFVDARSDTGLSRVSLFVVSTDNMKSTPIFTDEHALYAAYAPGPEGQLLIAVLRGSIVTYYVAHRDGSDLHRVYDSEIAIPTATPETPATATPGPSTPVPAATSVPTTQTP